MAKLRFSGPDPIVLAAKKMNVPLIDMTDVLCTDGRCPVVVGNVIVWRDKHHLTASYSRTLGNALGDRLSAAIR